ncbi:MAG: tetratricopeptide repeat protein, partial [candidate division Zixibacteria bacterium]|nr:tetratricopeptide repeat protein [candidate division Zixibacteria bacterium]
LRSQLAQETFDPLEFGEHRRVSTLFTFWRPSPRAAANEALWREVHSAVNEAADRCDGLWARSDPGGEYQKALILFGAITSAEDDVNRALECAHLLRERFNQIASTGNVLRFGIGLTTATVYAGWVGGPDRHEFTVMGEGVNLAARLAARAPKDGVLADRTSAEASQGWRFVQGPQLQLKGVRGPVTAFRLVAKADLPRGDKQDEFVQHPAAMDAALRRWEGSADGAVTVEFRPPADARPFISQYLRRLELKDEDVPRFRFLPDDGSHPHGGLRRFLLWCAGAQTVDELLNTLNDNREEVRSRVSLLYGPEYRLARVLAQDGVDAWVESTARFVAGLGVLAALRNRHPIVVLEQVHHLSDIDARLFSKLISSSGLRPRFIAVRQISASSADAKDGSVVTLGPITKGEMQRYVEQLLPQGTPSVQLLEWLHERSGAVARVARLYLEHLQCHGLITRRTGKRTLWHLRAAESSQLPDVLRSHHLGRIDALPYNSRLVARALAVMGDGAPQAALQSICESHLEAPAFAGGLSTLLAQGIVEQSDGAGERLLSYADASCRSSIYNTLSYAVREQWHRLAARYWRDRGRAGTVMAAEHLFCARDPRCLPVLERAAKDARRLWLLDRSRHLYRWALLAASDKCDPGYAPVLPPLPRVLDEQHRRLLRQFAEVLQIQGSYDEARRIHHCLSADAARRRQHLFQGESLLAAARIEWLSGHYDQALRLTGKVLRIRRVRTGSRLRAHAHFLIGEIARRTGGMRRAEQALERSVKLFEKSKDAVALADSLNALGLVHWSCGRLDEAQKSFVRAFRSLRKGSRAADPSKRGQIANNLGILMEERGRLRQAEQYYLKAFAIFDRLGHRRNRAYSQGNLANLFRHGGRYEQARAAYENVELELASIGEQHAAAYTIGNRGDLLRDFGDAEGAAELYQKTYHFARQVGDTDLIAESYCRLAQIQIGKRRLAEAERLVTNAAAVAERAGSREFAIRARLLQAEIRFEAGDRDAAHTAFSNSEREAAQAGLHYYLLWAGSGLARCLYQSGRLNDAGRRARRGVQKAHAAGYAWWELRFVTLAAEIEHASGSAPIPFESKLQQAINLKSAIEATIGDPAIRAAFHQLPAIQIITRLIARQAQEQPVNRE